MNVVVMLVGGRTGRGGRGVVARMTVVILFRPRPFVEGYDKVTKVMHAWSTINTCFRFGMNVVLGRLIGIGKAVLVDAAGDGLRYHRRTPSFYEVNFSGFVARCPSFC